MRHVYLVCYDISDERRLRKVYKAMCGYGDRLQYSVFECQFSYSDLARCRHAIGELIHHRQDQVLFVNLGPVEGRGDRVITTIGRAYSTLDSPCIIVDQEGGVGEAVPGTKRRVEAVERAGRKRVAARQEEDI